MPNIRVDKVLVGTPNYKAVLGDATRVLKIEVGVPTRNVLISNQVNLNDVVGITTSNIQEGDILVADENGILVNRANATDRIDGKVFNRDSDRGLILIRRSGDSGLPTGLYGGELAYSYLADPAYGTGGNGGNRLYFGVGSDGTQLATRIDVIGGKYFTDLLDHAHGILTKNSGVIVDSDKKINEWLVGGDLTVDNNTITVNLQADSARITNLSVETINAGDLATSLEQLLIAGEGIDIVREGNQIRILAEFATDTNAGISSFDSTSFQLGDSGQVQAIIFDGGSF